MIFASNVNEYSTELVLVGLVALITLISELNVILFWLQFHKQMETVLLVIVVSRVSGVERKHKHIPFRQLKPNILHLGLRFSDALALHRTTVSQTQDEFTQGN